MARSTFQIASGMALDALFPPRCAGCLAWCAPSAWHYDPFCPACAAKIISIEPPMCSRCGLPSCGTKTACPDCAGIMWPPALKLVRAIGAYDGPLREAIHRFKYTGKTALAEGLGARLQRWCAAQPPGVPRLPIERVQMIVPVPMHAWRRWQRGYNQSELLGRALGHRLGIPCRELLRRVRYAPPQVDLDAAGRASNVRGLFAPNEKLISPAVLAVPILLLDDVSTTGSTLYECARVLETAGAREVYALTLARTV